MKKDHRRECPICKNNEHTLLFQSELEDFDKNSCFENIRVSCCKACGFILNDTNITNEELNIFYSQESLYLSDTSFGTGGANDGDIYRYQKYLSVLAPYITKDSKICDVGCAKGGLLKFLKEADYGDVYGIELDPKLVQKATCDGLNVKLGSAADIPLPVGKYACMIFSHVFEHLLDFDNVLQSISHALADDGFVFIEVPNAMNYKEVSPFDFYWFIATKEHVNHFSSNYLSLLMQSGGFETIKENQYFMPYNNSNYTYPSLMMLFQKKQTIKAGAAISFNDELLSQMESYIEKETKRLEFHSSIVDKFIQNQAPIYCWGIGAEFFTMSTFTRIDKCNIVSLVDKNTQKQNLSFKGKRILSPDVFKTEQNNASVFIFSIFNNKIMKKFLEDINYQGDVIVFD